MQKRPVIKTLPRLLLPNKGQREMYKLLQTPGDNLTRQQKIEKQAFASRIKAMEKFYEQVKPLLEEQQRACVPAWCIKLAERCLPRKYFDFTTRFLKHVPPAWFGQWIPRLLFIIWSFKGPAEVKYLLALPLAIIEPFVIMTGIAACIVRLTLYYLFVAPWYALRKTLLTFGTSFKIFETEDGKAATIKIWYWRKEVLSKTLPIG